ncbi:MAG: hypothetical protein AMXMBFR23_28580 [Chloroflexota bacterium]
MRQLRWTMAATLLIAACGADGGDAQAPQAGGQESAAADGGATVDAPGDPAGLGDPSKPSDPSDPSKPSDPLDLPPECGEAPYDFRCPCYDNNDCESGWCIQDVVGRVCTATCLETCPDAWSCRSVQNVGEDVVYLCIPDLVALCTPCASDADCGGSDDLCLAIGGATHCAAGCDVDSDCPQGYACLPTDRDGARSQCVPTTGSCVCTAELLGTSMACAVTNEHGTCYGETTCAGVDGWTGCTAQAPAEEICDGVDNDCDGAFDEDTAGCLVLFADADGDGYGQSDMAQCLCAPEGHFTATEPGDCDDADPARHPGVPEVCNGADDDCNGLVDEGCDVDQDGWCASELDADPVACPLGGGDCNDLDPSVHPGVQETCNGKDDDCDGLTDEEGGAPCGGCAQVCQLEAGPDGGEPFNPGGLAGTGIDANGDITLDTASIALHMLWVANSAENTVSKIDTVTGHEVARYATCGDPSRTAVDLNGDCWVGCRGDGKVAKIALAESGCIDKNGNGTIETSRDLDGSGTIGGAELLPPGTDECVLLVVQPEANQKPRALAVDADNHPWVGYFETRKLHRLDPVSGETKATVDLSSVTSGKPYGMAIDQKGRIWVALRDGSPTALGLVDPSSFPIEPKAWGTPGGHAAYGIAVDGAGRVWLAGGESKKVSRFDPDTKTWKTLSLSTMPHARGVAASTDGKVYVAHHDYTTDCAGGKDHYVSVVDAATVTLVSTIDTSTGSGKLGPVGLAIDFDDHLWAIDQCSSTATKIDRKTEKVIAHYPTGSGPYTYSDMTGFALKTVVAPEGSYVHTFTGWSGVATKWLQINAAALLPPDTALRVRWRAANDPTDLALTPWSQWQGPFPPAVMPINLEKQGLVTGKHLQVEVSLKSSPTGAPLLKSLTAVGTPAP